MLTRPSVVGHTAAFVPRANDAAGGGCRASLSAEI